MQVKPRHADVTELSMKSKRSKWISGSRLLSSDFLETGAEPHNVSAGFLLVTVVSSSEAAWFLFSRATTSISTVVLLGRCYVLAKM